MKAVRENIANLVPHKKTSFMINLQIEGLTKSFGDRVLFTDIAFGLSEGERVGLIAKNGTGKTTLLNIIAGDESYDSGTIRSVTESGWDIYGSCRFFRRR